MAETSYGLIAEFKTADALLEAARAARQAGFTQMDAYTPFPVTGLAEALDFSDARVDFWALTGGLLGAAFGFGVAVVQNVWQFPINVGGRPLLAWPAFMIPGFEMAVLFSVSGAVIAALALSGLPRLHHPLFDAPRFNLVTQDRFFLVIEAADARYDEAAAFFETLDPAHIEAVAA